MNNSDLSYAAIQFSSAPESFEALNVGVVVFNGQTGEMRAKTTEDFSRLVRFFGAVNNSFIRGALDDFVGRLQSELRIGGLRNLESHRISRANNIRLTKFMPVFSLDIETAQESLFSELVGRDKPKKRSTRVGRRLKDGLTEMGILKHFDLNPETVTLPRFGVTLKPDLGIKKEKYTLIEAVRFDDPENGFAAAGMHALAGRALTKNNFNFQLVVVGDFGEQSEGFYNAVKEDLNLSNIPVFRLDSLPNFAAEIVPNRFH